ncbi:outer membrane immunogenic protein [Sphingomonas naasensis]|uniref:Porin family protein n=1 Tax=Sphingomonas naasensis TaxID=1344951 RepID=A0A4S1W8U0_9SPHN|nr:outer membrane beta-barrel protein [Sphingomonas naasensis]NIJ19427.1 outer membrane immunogenic protein [Sphingomonas naasensis]TGX39168.1 porin family protein [Sphingomonas naasensis]
MRILATTALALVAATATPAFAQDGSFTGPRAEVVAGWDHVGGLGDGESGFAYGGAIGYDQQLGNVVIGADAEITGSTTERADVSAGRDLYAGVRAGFVVPGAILVYGKGGYTNARVSFAGTGENFDGYRLGAGVERSFGKFYGKVEYRYSRYDDAELNRDQVVAGIGFRF